MPIDHKTTAKPEVKKPEVRHVATEVKPPIAEKPEPPKVAAAVIPPIKPVIHAEPPPTKVETSSTEQSHRDLMSAAPNAEEERRHTARNG